MKQKKIYTNPETGEKIEAHGLYEIPPHKRMTSAVLKRRAANRKKRKARRK